MPVSAATLRLLMEAGVAGDDLLAIVESIDMDAQPAKSAAAVRQARYRAKQKGGDVTSDVTDDMSLSLSPETKAPTPPKTQTPNPPPSPPKGGSVPQGEPIGFEDFWRAYPRRDGANPRKPAVAAYSRALKRGGTPERLLAAAGELAAKHPEVSPYVPQAVTWLNQDRWRQDEATGPPTPAVVQFRRAEDIIEERIAENERKRALSGP